MSNRFFLLRSLFLIFGLVACGGEESPSEVGKPVREDTLETTDRRLVPAEPASPPCPVEGEMLPGNWILVNNSGLLLTVSADSATYDEQLGFSHRVVQLFDTSSCERLDRQVLPVNRAPDYAYQIAEIIYNNNSRLIAIRGFDILYCYDVGNRQLLPALSPQFKTNRYGIDAQSGMIRRVEVWEDFLVGYAQDFGAFCFDLRDKQQPKAVLPFAEYQTPENGYASLFLLPSGDRDQLLLPDYHPGSDHFEINPLLEKPVQVSPNVPKSALNNRFIVLRLLGDTRTAIAIDMLDRERVELPSELQAANTQEILEWLKRNRVKRGK